MQFADISQRHHLMGEKLHLYKRPHSRYWQCSTYLAGKEWRRTTKEESLAHAKDVAEDWYLELRAKHRLGMLASVNAPQRQPASPSQFFTPPEPGKVFREAAAQFLREYPVLVQGQRNQEYVEGYEMVLRVYVLPYFGDMPLTEITAGKVQEFRVHRVQTSRTGKSPSKTVMSRDTTVIRQVLKTAHRHGWLSVVPDLSLPYRTAGKVGHRAWFSPVEYRQLYEATRKRIDNPPAPFTERWKWAYEQLHDTVLFLGNTGLRPDEAKRLEFRDVSIVVDEDTDKEILEIEVRGKRGYGHCKSTPGAVLPFRRLMARNMQQSTDKLFPTEQRELFNTVLAEENLKFDREENRRTLYSLRHTYICLRLIQGADIYQLAKNCRTSVEMIEKHYAVHLKDTLDAAAINRRKPPRHRRRKQSGRSKR